MIESSGHNIIIKTANENYTYRSTMKNMLEKIGAEKIVQIQKAYAVNMDYIKEVDKNVIILKNSEEYNIGRKFKDTFIQKYKERFLK